MFLLRLGRRGGSSIARHRSSRLRLAKAAASPREVCCRAALNRPRERIWQEPAWASCLLRGSEVDCQPPLDTFGDLPRRHPEFEAHFAGLYPDDSRLDGVELLHEEQAVIADGERPFELELCSPCRDVDED